MASDVEQPDHAIKAAGHDAASTCAEAHGRQPLVADWDPRDGAAAAGVPEPDFAGKARCSYARIVGAEACVDECLAVRKLSWWATPDIPDPRKTVIARREHPTRVAVE